MQLALVAVINIRLYLCFVLFLRYILDLNKEQETGFAETVVGIALKAEFEPWQKGRSDDVHAVFVPQRK